MAEAIYGVLNYNALSNYLKNYGKQEVNQLTWDKAAAKIKEVYYQVA